MDIDGAAYQTTKSSKQGATQRLRMSILCVFLMNHKATPESPGQIVVHICRNLHSFLSKQCPTSPSTPPGADPTAHSPSSAYPGELRQCRHHEETASAVPPDRSVRDGTDERCHRGGGHEVKVFGEGVHSVQVSVDVDVDGWPTSQESTCLRK